MTEFKAFVEKQERNRRPWLFRSTSICGICGRELVNPSSVAKGIGPVCEKHLGPGSHPSGSPQSAHAGGKEAKGKPNFSPGSDREARRKRGIYDVISETDEETAKILLTQGVEPSFKPRIAGRGPIAQGAPGKGLEREGLYTANEETFSKGSFGRVRLYLTTRKKSLAVPEEGTRLGWKREEIDPVLESNVGAITVGALPKSAFAAVEVQKAGKWVRMSPSKYLKSIGIDPNTPKLPDVSSYRKWVEKNAETLSLSPDKVDWVVHDYNRASLEDKIWMAKEAGFV